MPYPIRATAGNSFLPILRKQTYGNVGVNQGGYGSTASTGFWNGKPPNVGGYIVYVGNGTSSPTMYVVATDNELITLSNTLGGGSNTMIGQALYYFMVQINMICFNVEPPNVVTDNLILYLDANVAFSYPRISTAWNDISRGLNNSTLINGPTYSSDGGGSISFDGVDDYVDCGNPVSTQSLSQMTMSVWVKFFGLDYSFGTGELIGFMSKGYPDTLSPNTGFWFAYDNRSNGSSFTYTCFGNTSGGFAGGVNNFSSKSYIFTNNVWYNITATVNSSSQGTLYINGVQQGSSVTFSNLSIPNTANTLYVGRIEIPGYSIYGNIAQTQLYDRALTSVEVLQNYYAGLQRFIPTDNMVLWLDGTNTNTRVITPTTAYDRSGNNNNGTFANGAVLAHRDGGTVFNFDGVDEKVQTTIQTLASSTTWTVWVKRTQSMGVYNMIMGMFLPYFSSMSDGSIHFSNYIGGFQRSLYAYVGLTDNIWYHITFVSSFNAGNTTMMIYLNGLLQTQATYAGQQPTTTSNSFRLGGWEDGNSWPFNGKIGDVRLYSRVLTATEISTIYNADRPRYGL